MIGKLLVIVSITMLAITAYPQGRVANSSADTPASAPREIKIGEAIKLSDSLTVKVSQPAASPFSQVKVSGVPVVLVLELDSGKKVVTLSCNINNNTKSSNMYLANGTQRYAPTAVVEDFPSWGADNDKEIEVLDPKDSEGSESLQFEGKGSVSLLFDVPAAQAKVVKKLSVKIRTTQPKDEQISFVVNM